MRISDLEMRTQAKHWTHSANRQGIGHTTKECHGALAFEHCLVPRRLSFHENVRAKEGGKKTTRLYPSHGPLRFITSHSFRARLCHAKNEAPEEEAVSNTCYFETLVLLHVPCRSQRFELKQGCRTQF